MHSIVNDVDTCSSRVTNATPKGAVLALYDDGSERASTTPEGPCMHAHIVDIADTVAGRPRTQLPRDPHDDWVY